MSFGNKFEKALSDLIDDHINAEVDQFMQESVALSISASYSAEDREDDLLVYPFILDEKSRLTPHKAIHSPKKVYLTDMFDGMLEDCTYAFGGIGKKHLVFDKEEVEKMQARWELVKKKIDSQLKAALDKAE